MSYNKSKTKKEPIPLPSSKYIYELLFVEYINKIKSLELRYIDLVKKKINSQSIKSEIISNSKFVNILFTDPNTNPYINIEIPVNIQGIPIEPKDINIANKLNQFVIFIDYFEVYWIICGLVEMWISAGGVLSDISSNYLSKYDKIKFLNELYKGFGDIDSVLVNTQINKYDKKISQLDKTRFNTYQIYLLMKKKDVLTPLDLENVAKYYDMGIDKTLLDEHKIKKMYESLDKYFTNKDVEVLSSSDLEKYEKIINDFQYNSADKKEKINSIYKKYYSHHLNKLLSKSDYRNLNKINYYIDKLESLGYTLTSKQKKKLKLPLDKKVYKFEKESWYPVFSSDELDCLKNEILYKHDIICDEVKKIFPYYKISYDLFCSSEKKDPSKLIYDNQEDINKTISTYCIIIILVGIINSKLYDTRQDYQIILKGGKTLQLLLSSMYKTHVSNPEIKFFDPDYKSNDIDLIINPIVPQDYNENKCGIFANNFAYLVKWILNKSDNPYIPENYITSIQGTEYKTLIKLSHKIQKSDQTYSEPKFTAIVDIDYGKKNELVYNNLVYDTFNSSLFGKLLFIHQDYNDYLAEKIYYLNYYIGEKNKLEEMIKITPNEVENEKVEKTKIEKAKMEKAKIEKAKIDNYQRFISKFANQIKKLIQMKLGANTNPLEIKSFLNDVIVKNNLIIDVNVIMDKII